MYVPLVIFAFALVYVLFECRNFNVIDHIAVAAPSRVRGFDVTSQEVEKKRQHKPCLQILELLFYMFSSSSSSTSYPLWNILVCHLTPFALLPLIKLDFDGRRKASPPRRNILCIQTYNVVQRLNGIGVHNEGVGGLAMSHSMQARRLAL